MATTTINYGTLNSLTVTSLQTLADGVFWQSAKIDNTELGMWMELFLTLKTNASTGDANGTIDVYLAGSIDAGTDFAGGASGTEGSYSITANNDEKHLRFVSSLSCDASEASIRTYKYHITVHDLPEDFSIIIANQSGQAFDTSGNTVEYRINKFDSA